ncbi:MAG: M1 family metallopeptidase [Bacteroidetes bacterium]|nr:M1 family metallopeptidase [Bacteroidota bacterium]
MKKIYTTHLDLELDVSFQNKTIYGVARHTMKNKGTDTAIFDIKGLKIQKITLGEKNNERETDFVIGNMDVDSVLGQPLLVSVDKNTSKINIYYQTTENSEALGWLDSNLTSSKSKPFLFTQGQAILTRTWIPLQDSPSNRITYKAKVKVPKDLMAVMSAKNYKKINNEGNYEFSMNKAIPSYLISLAVGDLVYHPFSKNSGVYCEPQLLKASSYEFIDLPKMIAAAEKLYGKYQWEQYDLLVLPYSFPYGGMENPMLTFVNPTIIAGDKSLVSVVAHELAHSWSGNLVTNRTWNDFWLNESFTVYFEERIMEELYGKDVSDILGSIERYDLENELERIKNSKFPEDSRLFLELKKRNPDEAMTAIAYVKGAFFLKTLEQKVGRKRFDNFLNSYFKKFAFKTVNSTIFADFLETKLLKPNQIKFNYKEWIYKQGLPSNCIKINSGRLNRMKDFALNYSKGIDVFAPKIKFKFVKVKGKKKRKKFIEQIKRSDFIVQEWQTFIHSLPENIGKTKLQKLDTYFSFKNCGNSEIMTDWFVLGIKNNYTQLNPEIETFLGKVGRRKYVLPIYETLLNNKKTETMANDVFEKNKKHYHSVTKKSIEELIKN